MDLNLSLTLVAVFVAVGLLAWSTGNMVLERSSPTRRPGSTGGATRGGCRPS